MKLTPKIPLAFLLLGTTLAAWAQNNPPIGCVTHTADCCMQGNVSNKGALSFYTAITCVGGGVTPPTLATPVTFNPGLRCDNYTDTCNNTNWTVYTSVPYTAGPLYWDASISNAFTSCGVFPFYGKVDGTPSDPLCSKVTATVGPGNPGTPFTVSVVQAEVEAVDYWSDYIPFYNYTADFAGNGTTTFSRPIWQRSPAINNPVVQPQGQAVGLYVTINSCGAGFKLIGLSSVPGLCFTNASVGVGNQRVTVTASVPLATDVDVLSGSIDWYAVIGGPAWNSPTQMCYAGTSGPHTNYVTWANPYGSIATLRRIDWACNLVKGYSDIDAIEAKIHDTLVHDFDLDSNCVQNAWIVLDNLYPQGQGYDCVSLVTCHMLVSWTLGLTDASVNYACASTDSACSTQETRPCPGGVHGSETLYFLDSKGRLNNYEACCVADTWWYPGGIPGRYSSAVDVTRYWLTNGATQAWIYPDTNRCTNPGPYPVPSP